MNAGLLVVIVNIINIIVDVDIAVVAVFVGSDPK